MHHVCHPPLYEQKKKKYDSTVEEELGRDVVPAQMRILQCRTPVDTEKTNTSRLGNDTLQRKRKQRLRGKTDTKGKVCNRAGKPDSPDVELFPSGRIVCQRSRFTAYPERVAGQAHLGSSALTSVVTVHSFCTG